MLLERITVALMAALLGMGSGARAAPVAPSALVERELLLVVVIPPPGHVSGISSSRVLDAVESAVEKYTSLELRSADQVGVDPGQLAECPAEGRMRCWMRSAVLPATQRPRYMFLISLHPASQEQDSLLSILIDLDGLPVEADEGQVFERSTMAEALLTSKDPALLTQAIFDLFQGKLRPQFEASGHFGALGGLVISGLEPGMRIELDGLPLPVGRTESLVLRGVRPGVHQLTGIMGDGRRSAGTVWVGQAMVTHTSIPRLPADSALRTATVISGGVLLAAGLALTAAALVKASDGVAQGCFSEREDLCPGSSFVTSGAPGPDGLRVQAGAFEGGGPQLAPLGFGLIFSGAAFTLGTFWFGEANEPPWIPLLVGTVGGALVYGVAAIAAP